MSPTERVLVAMEYGQRRSQLTAGLKALGLATMEVEDCKQARRALAKRNSLELVISDATFRDGDWRDTLAAAQRRPDPASFLVSAPFPDNDLWSEALWCGAHDLLVEPYTTAELRRTIEGALRARGRAAAYRSLREAV